MSTETEILERKLADTEAELQRYKEAVERTAEVLGHNFSTISGITGDVLDMSDDVQAIQVRRHSLMPERVIRDIWLVEFEPKFSVIRDKLKEAVSVTVSVRGVGERLYVSDQAIASMPEQVLKRIIEDQLTGKLVKQLKGTAS